MKRDKIVLQILNQVILSVPRICKVMYLSFGKKVNRETKDAAEERFTKLKYKT